MQVHDLKICHRDIKPANIVYFENEKLWKIVDFSLTKQYLSVEKFYDLVGTPGFLPTEKLNEMLVDEEYNEAKQNLLLNDIFALTKSVMFMNS